MGCLLLVDELAIDFDHRFRRFIAGLDDHLWAFLYVHNFETPAGVGVGDEEQAGSVW